MPQPMTPAWIVGVIGFTDSMTCPGAQFIAEISVPNFFCIADETHFKLYLSDVGLLRAMAGLTAEAILAKSNEYREFKGAMTENFFLEEWMHRHESAPYFWKSGNEAEVDFIISNGSEAIPVEVKSERNNRAKALAEYCRKYTPKIAVETSMNNIETGYVRHVPLYLLWQLEKYLT